MSILGTNKIAHMGSRFFDGLNNISNVLITRFGRHKTVEAPGGRRLTIIQFGDYAEAFRRFASGGDEDYYGQKKSVKFVAQLAARKEIQALTVISLASNAAPEVLSCGIETLGVELYPRGQRPRYRELIKVVNRASPTHLIVMSPILPLICWGVRARIPVLPVFADSFRAKGLKVRVQSRVLAFLLNDPSIEIVANHNLAAALELKRIGVDPRKIVPFDWAAFLSPYEAKSAPIANLPFRLIYVGSLIETKGVGDAIKAVSMLHKRGKLVELTIIGRGDSELFKKLAIAEQIEQYVFFLGPKNHSEVIAAMRDHDAVLVPSHWAYPEGLPMTLYESLCTRTPLLTSDHPMFALKIRDRYNALVFPERNPEALAECINELATSPELYAKLSKEAGNAADSFLCPLKYDRLISDYLNPTERGKLRNYSLANYNYS